MPPIQQTTPNLLLSTLSAESFESFSSSLERVELRQGDFISEPDRPVRHLYFPEDGVLSIVVSSPEAVPTEVGMLGFEGMSGHFIALGARSSPFATMVQVEGCSSLRIETNDFLARLADTPELRDLVLKFVHTLQIQIAYNVFSQAHFHMESRLARWLIMCCDRATTDNIRLTHEFMAVMLGVQRSSVTVTLHVLEGLGAIRSIRGIVQIRDRAKLEELAGGTYGPAELEYCRLIAPFGRPPAAGP